MVCAQNLPTSKLRSWPPVTNRATHRATYLESSLTPVPTSTAHPSLRQPNTGKTGAHSRGFVRLVQALRQIRLITHLLIPRFPTKHRPSPIPALTQCFVEYLGVELGNDRNAKAMDGTEGREPGSRVEPTRNDKSRADSLKNDISDPNLSEMSMALDTLSGSGSCRKTTSQGNKELD